MPHRPAVWHSATRALIGLYFNDDPAGTANAFEATLGSLEIGDQLASKPDSQKQLVGEPWFAYGTRYGLFLALASQPARMLPGSVDACSSTARHEVLRRIPNALR